MKLTEEARAIKGPHPALLEVRIKQKIHPIYFTENNLGIYKGMTAMCFRNMPIKLSLPKNAHPCNPS